MIHCTVKLEFSAAKRLLNYKGKCNHLHGYRHAIEVCFTGDQDADLTVDFYILKEKLGNWLNKEWDHNLLLNQEDSDLGNAISSATGQSVFYFTGDPTAENMAKYIKEYVCAELFPDVICKSVRVYDSENAWVEVE